MIRAGALWDLRRYAAIIIAAVMLFTTTACTEKQRTVNLSENEAYVKYVKAVDKVRAAGSFAGHIVLYGVFSMMEFERENNVLVGVKHIFGSGDDFQAEIDASWTDAEFISYYKDGMYYLNAYDECFRYSMPGYAFLKMTLSMLVTEVLFPEEDIFGLEVVEDSQGTAIRFEVYQSGMQSVLRQLADYEDTGGFEIYSEDDVGYVFEDVVVRMRIDKSGMLRDIRLAFIYQASHYHIDEDAEVTGYLEIGINTSQIGGVTIDYPDDMDSYPDLETVWE